MNSSISRQLVFWLAIPLILLALCGALVHYFNSVAPSVISHDQRLREASNALLARVLVENGAVTLDTHSDRRQALPETGSIRYAVRDTHARLLAGDPQMPIVPIDNETNRLFAISPIDGRNQRTLTTRLSTRAGPVIITVADMRPTTEPVARYNLMSTLLWDFVQLDVTLVLVWIGIQIGLRPVKKLRAQIAERSPADLRPIDESAVPQEIAAVVTTLNRLFLTLRTSVQSQQQFIANTAHQLRTPLTGMQAQLDLLIAEPAALPVKPRLLTLQEGARQLTHSANQLLTLARADPAVNVTAKNQVLDLTASVAEVVARFFDRALKSNIDLGAEVRPVSLRADPSLIDDLLSNLIDNALKYTPAGGRVTVSAGDTGGKPFLAVEDTGPGIPEPERQRVRQRFYRLPNSPGHGSGLGLAIVDEIARLYDASMTISSGADGRGTKVSLQFGRQ